MRLSDQEFAEFKELKKLAKQGKLTDEQTARLAELEAIKSDKQDPAWYKKYIALYNDAAKLAFNYRPGTTMRFINTGHANELYQGNLMVAYYYSHVGKCVGMNDALNLSARKLWTALNKAYRGINVYEQSDVGIMLFCCYNVAEIIAHAERLLGIAQRFKATDTNYPRAFYSALNLSMSDWNTGEALKNFAFDLNQQIERFNSLFVPKEVTYIARHVAINSLLFMDAKDSGKSNLFMYVPRNFWLWNPIIFNSGSAAISHELNDYATGTGGTFTPDDIINIITTQLDALTSDQDITKMCSDLLNVVGEQHSLKLGAVDINYKIEAIYNEMWLQQWHNIETLGTTVAKPLASAIDGSIIDGLHPIPTTPVLAIYQVDNIIVSNAYELSNGFGYRVNSSGNYIPSGTVSIGNVAPVLTEDGIVDTWVPEPNTDIVMELSRNKVRGTFGSFLSGGNAYNYCILDTNDIIIHNFVIYAYDMENDRVVQSAGYRTVMAHSSLTALELIWLTKFDWHPVLYTQLAADATVPFNYPDALPFGDLDNFAVLSRGNLDKMNRAALLSLFDLEQLISIVDRK